MHKSIIFVTAVDIKVFAPEDMFVVDGKTCIEVDNTAIEVKGQQFVNDKNKVVIIQWSANLQNTLGLPFTKFTEHQNEIAKLQRENKVISIEAKDIIIRRDKQTRQLENVIEAWGYMPALTHILLSVTKIKITKWRLLVAGSIILYVLNHVVSFITRS